MVRSNGKLRPAALALNMGAEEQAGAGGARPMLRNWRRIEPRSRESGKVAPTQSITVPIEFYHKMGPHEPKLEDRISECNQAQTDTFGILAEDLSVKRPRIQWPPNACHSKTYMKE